MAENTENKTKKRDDGYDFIRFFAMLLIVVYHFFTTCMEMNFRFPPFLKSLFAHGNITFGRIGVALFFMLSGAVLILTNSTISPLKFYKKRLVKIEIPQIFGFIMAFFAVYIVNKEILKSNIIGILISAAGLNYFGIPWSYFGIQTLWLIGEWFTTVIIILYVLFPLLRFLFYKARAVTTLAIFVIFILNLKFLILSSSSGSFSITNGLMCFWLGMLFNEYKKYINNKILITNLLILAALWIINPNSILGYNYLPSFLFSVLLFTVLYRIKIRSNFTNYICKYNYEIYLVHHRIFILFMPALLTSHSNDLQVILAFVLLTSFVCWTSEFLQKCSNIVQNNLIFDIKNLLKRKISGLTGLLLKT